MKVVNLWDTRNTNIGLKSRGHFGASCQRFLAILELQLLELYYYNITLTKFQ